VRRSFDKHLKHRHLKILVAAIAITLFFTWLWQGTLFTSDLWVTLISVFLQLEIFLAIALKIFKDQVARPDTAYKKKIVTRLAVFYLIVLIMAAIFVFLSIAASASLHHEDLSNIFKPFVSEELKRFFLSWIISVTIASVAFFYMEWNNALKREQKLREEKLIFQYETLKNQVNPHFLFNSLNTLSSLIAKDRDLSEKFVAKFSTIYRYVLDKSDKETVSLAEEIALVKDYFFLQKIRSEGKINLVVDVEHPERFKSLPISLQLLVENALKHNSATHQAPLNIRIHVENDEMLVVENNIQKKVNLEPSSRIGLKNLNERITLMLNKPLVIEEGDDKFVVKLPIVKIA
jgi:sensor histidine kinase YesM